MQTLYDAALKEFDAQQYESACRKLEEVTKLAPDGLGAKLTLGKCYEAIGRLASAFSQYALVADIAPKLGQSERAEKAAQKLAELKPRLAMLTLDVPKETASIAGFSLTCDGIALDSTQWSVPLPVDTGLHEVVAKAPGRSAWTTQVKVKTDGEKVWLSIPPLAAPTPAPAAAPLPAESAPETTSAPERPWQRPAAIAALAAGGAGIAVGAVLGVMTISKNNASNDGHCNAKDECTRTGYDLRKEALAFGNGSTAAMVVGGVLLGGGVVLLVTAPQTKSRSHNTESGRVPGMNATLFVLPGGVQVKGTW